MSIIQALLKHGANINETDALGYTPLSNAVMAFRNFKAFDKTKPNFDVDMGQRQMVEFLLRNGANVQARTNVGESILHLIANQAGCSQRIYFAELMLERGVDVNAVDCDGLTPLHVAVGNIVDHQSDIPLIKLFEKYGANVNALSPQFGTPLHAVISKYRFEPEQDEILDHILNHPDVKFDVQDSFGNTPLHIAAEKCVRESVTSCLEKLLYSGADINLVNSEGLSPLHRFCEWLIVNFEDDSDLDFFDNSHETDEFVLEMFEMIATYLKKLMKRNGLIDEKVSEKFNRLVQLRPDESAAIDLKIEEGLKKMKSRIVNQHTSLYDILFKNAGEMVIYVNNDNFKKVMESPELHTEFPLFHDTLSLQYIKGLRKSLILEKGKLALTFLTKVNWPEYCAEYILNFLADDDLRALAESASVTSSCLKSGQYRSVQRGLPQKRPRCE